MNDNQKTRKFAVFEEIAVVNATSFHPRHYTEKRARAIYDERCASVSVKSVTRRGTESFEGPSLHTSNNCH